MTDLQFDPSERQYLLEHFRVKYNEAARSERPGAAEVAQTWLNGLPYATVTPMQFNLHAHSVS